MWLLVLTSFFLTGCVHYDIGLNFHHSHGGELVQHIKLGERLTSFSGQYIYEWLNSVESRARQLEGKIQRISLGEVIVTIPFSNGEELGDKFNYFFNSDASGREEDDSTPEIPAIKSNVILQQNNFLLLVRNHLTYDLDLRSLSLISGQGNVISNASSLLNLQFSLNTPWGARNIDIDDITEPEQQGKQLLWTLKPGKTNHIEVIFWLPSPLGIGSLVIILFIWGGIHVRYNILPAPDIQVAPKVVATE